MARNGSLFYRACKRTFDIAFSAAAIVLLAAPMAVLCAMISAESPGAPLYSQERVGQGGRLIRVIKVRTMVADADDVTRHLTPEQLEQWEKERKVEGDPRVTRVGRLPARCHRPGSAPRRTRATPS